MYIYTPIVSVEITRKCNLDCEHCLRGNPSNVNIKKEILERFFDEVKIADVLVISGGEPFMCYSEIKLLCEIIKMKKVNISSVVIVTNGTIYDERVYKLLEDNFDKVGINISMDKYHIDALNRMYNDISSYEKCLKNINLHRNNIHFAGLYGNSKYLIDMGRAKDLNVPKVPFDALGYFYNDTVQNFSINNFVGVGPRIYLDALGNITDGNSSYESREDILIGNIMEESLLYIIYRGAIKVEFSSLEEFREFMMKREHENEYGLGEKYVYQDKKIVKVSDEKLVYRNCVRR